MILSLFALAMSTTGVAALVYYTLSAFLDIPIPQSDTTVGWLYEMVSGGSVLFLTWRCAWVLANSERNSMGRRSFEFLVRIAKAFLLPSILRYTKCPVWQQVVFFICNAFLAESEVVKAAPSAQERSGTISGSRVHEFIVGMTKLFGMPFWLYWMESPVWARVVFAIAHVSATVTDAQEHVKNARIKNEEPNFVFAVLAKCRPEGW